MGWNFVPDFEYSPPCNTDNPAQVTASGTSLTVIQVVACIKCQLDLTVLAMVFDVDKQYGGLQNARKVKLSPKMLCN